LEKPCIAGLFLLKRSDELGSDAFNSDLQSNDLNQVEQA
jgi:hypothetical protein